MRGRVNSVSITSAFTLADWAAYRQACHRRLHRSETTGGQWLRIVLWVTVGVLLVPLANARGASFQPLSFLLGIGLVFGASMLNWRLVSKRSAPEANGAFFKEHTYEFDHDGIHVHAADNRSFSSWATIRELTRSADHLFLWTDRYVAFIIPLRDVPEQLSPDSLQRAIEHWQESDAATTSVTAKGTPAVPALSDPEGRLKPTERWPRFIVRLIMLRRGAAPSNAPKPALLAALLLSCLGIWMLADWLLTQPSPVFFYYGMSDVAWYLVAGLALALVVTSWSVPRIDYTRSLIVVLAPLPALMIVLYLLDWYASASWATYALIATLTYLIPYLWRATEAMTGQPQTRVVVLVLLVAAAFSWATDELYVRPMMWIADDPDGSEFDNAWERAEPLFFSQSSRVDQALDSIRPNDPEHTDVFFLGFAGYGDQRVFTQEIELAAEVVGARYSSNERQLLLVNDARDLERRPLATTSTLRYAIKGIAERMDVGQDVLFLSLSSHGSQSRELSVTNGMLPLSNLTSMDLAMILDDAGIQWRVIAISACFSGGFIEDLQNPYTIIFTAAAPDRPSFGCSDERELTYFGEAFYRDALPMADSLREAFLTAKAGIAERELQEGIQLASDPRAFFGAELERKLSNAEAL
jgi:hypothetical protein